MTYKQFTIEEREKIQRLLWEKKSLRNIAKELNRSPSSISRELRKNTDSLGRHRYVPRLAQAKAIKKRSSRGRGARLKNDELRAYVTSHLKLGWSPEQIANTAKQAVGESISHEAVYQYVYAQVHRNGYGQLRPGCEDLRPYLPRRRKRRMKKGMRVSYRTDKGLLPSIDLRPKEVESRQEVGHWEDDLIVSRQSLAKLKTINERVSGLVMIRKINNGTIEEANKAVIGRLGEIPQKYRKTLTRDRGSENLGYGKIQEALGISCYFAHAYHSWERGSNENLNGLIRRFFPKKTDFKSVSEEEIRRVEHLLNSRPRKRLGWKTPYEVFYLKTGVALKD